MSAKSTARPASPRPRGHRAGRTLLSQRGGAQPVQQQPELPAGQDPQFDLYAVSTGSGTCTFDLSPDKLYVVVMSAGHVIWDFGRLRRRRRPGQPSSPAASRSQESVTWNRSITLPGCVTLASAARPGTYQAQARTPVDSPVQDASSFAAG
jgi:hypothetical protein